MARKKFSQEEIIEEFFEVFRAVGYEGTSLEDLATASGMRKSSLYHHFPGGKKQMAEAVLKHTNLWIKSNITNVLNADSDPEKRLVKALKAINELYDGGKKACILRALSMDTGLHLFSTLINEAFEDLLGGFTKLLIDMRYDKKEAIRHSENILMMIQGALIVGKGIGDDRLFPRLLREIKRSIHRK